jgi:hypothetical protein
MRQRDPKRPPNPKRTPKRAPRRSRERELATIHPLVLSQVIGGRVSPRTTLDPVLLQGLQQLSQAIVSVGQSMSAAKQGASQQMMQMLEQLMQQRGGGRKR